MTKKTKKTVKIQQVKTGKGKDCEGRYDGSIENCTMFPVTCKDGLFQFRFNAEEKQTLESKAAARKCKMAELFNVSNMLFRNQMRADLKNAILSRVSTVTGNNYRSVVQYVKEQIIGA
jgi:hypothetical protein